MSKRIWILLALAVMFSGALSACGSSELAEDLTPIPTLPPGEEPSLAAPLAGSAPVEGDSLSEDELVALGETTFAAKCAFCHGPEDGTGPAFTGMAARAAERVEDMSAADYLLESIVEPDAHLVEGYGPMPPVAGQLSENEIAGLVAYILDKSGDTMTTGSEETPKPTEEPEPTTTPTDEPTSEPEPTTMPTEEPSSEPEAEVDLALGETLFAANCAACHGASVGAGPALTGMSARASEEVEGMSAEDYLHESIVDPSAHMVEGFSDIMPKVYGEQFSAEEIASIIGYILAQ